MLKTAFPAQRSLNRWLWSGIVLAFVIWVGADLFIPRKNSIRQFDASEVARLETAMWRSYYDKKPVVLFWQLAGGLRQQFHASFWRSFVLAFQATKAAFVFKNGASRTDYQQALPGLIAYYADIQGLTVEQFDVVTVAKLELEWWIIHRERSRYSYANLSTALVQTSAALYRQPAPAFVRYGTLRANAMRLCDEAGRQSGGASEADWQHIDQELIRAWRALYAAVHKPAS